MKSNRSMNGSSPKPKRRDWQEPEDLPIIIELVDAADKIETFLSFVEQHIHSGLLATMEKVEVRFYRGDKSSAPKTPLA
jgi:PII-like signaling protein